MIISFLDPCPKRRRRIPALLCRTIPDRTAWASSIDALPPFPRRDSPTSPAGPQIPWKTPPAVAPSKICIVPWKNGTCHSPKQKPSTPTGLFNSAPFGSPTEPENGCAPRPSRRNDRIRSVRRAPPFAAAFSPRRPPPAPTRIEQLPPAESSCPAGEQRGARPSAAAPATRRPPPAGRLRRLTSAPTTKPTDHAEHAEKRNHRSCKTFKGRSP